MQTGLTDAERKTLNDLVERVIGAVYEVAGILGAGFLEKVYERALLSEFRLRGTRAECQVPIRVMYKNEEVGNYCADMIAEEKLLIELKCVDRFANEHIAQCLNYLKATNLHIALVVNFQHPRVEWKRIVRDF